MQFKKSQAKLCCQIVQCRFLTVVASPLARDRLYWDNSLGRQWLYSRFSMSSRQNYQAIKNRVPDVYLHASRNPVIFFAVRPHYLFPPQPLPPAGFLAGASCVVELFSIWVPPAPDFSALHPVEAHPVSEIPAPPSKLAMLRPANNFFRSFLSMSTSTHLV